ncbi:hypothetical protein Zmor_004141 [Zophobas morio]|uniref:Uncharacterized protein n=1 Tax=Zophobas morio TaxID=2755281 RepID=A0AA38LZV5_9CUCU|nr:hypothetical protein Zmor_004141 [Zophobas morio]
MTEKVAKLRNIFYLDHGCISRDGWPRGLRRWIKDPVSSGARVRIPLRSVGSWLDASATVVLASRRAGGGSLVAGHNERRTGPGQKCSSQKSSARPHEWIARRRSPYLFLIL